MKETTGELNMTVITVVAIVAVAAFFTAFILPKLRGSIQANVYCSSAVGCGACDDENKKTCTGYYDDAGAYKQETITCNCND